MDVKKCMIVDLQERGNKRMFITTKVQSITEDKIGFWSVKFFSSSQIFRYNQARLLYFRDSETINLNEKGLYVKNRHITNVAELLRFTNGRYTFYHVTYTNGYYEDLDGREVYVTHTPIDKYGGTLWDYLCKLASETGLMSEDEESILSKQYELVDVQRDNVPLAQYIGCGRGLAIYPQPRQIYYPFGCNASQKKAVEAALTHQVSIIQGPPGTGKTQTILNVISNLLINGKTVLVVAYNNSAVCNVEEKLKSEGLDFIVAKLGSVKNREAFIENQPDYPNWDGWSIDEAIVRRQAALSLSNVVQGFDLQTRESQLKAEYDALQKEAKYNEMLHQNTKDCDWLKHYKSTKLINLHNLYQRRIDSDRKPGFLFRLKCAFSMGLKMFSFLKGVPSQIVASLEAAFYLSRKVEIEQELETIASMLETINIKQDLKELRSSSLQVLKHRIAKRYVASEREKFKVVDIKARSERFLYEYPVVLSTTYSAKSCINKNMVFDYVIMDEASQVDIKTGALVLSCATNVVIVGDNKQLPNVVSQEEETALNAIMKTYHVGDSYNAVTHSFLQSCIEVFDGAPTTLLREHYRCHPKIIEFCNQQFYNGELISMTADNGEKNVLQLIRTVKGNHARGHFNQREIDVIANELLSEYESGENIGIITPYRLQAEEINKVLGKDIASTVHKYQGRECDTVIISLVDNNPTAFSDDANLINVAISRAKKRLCIVTNGNEIPQDTNIGQLVGYIRYNNFEVKESKLHSVFDLLYGQYTIERLAYEKASHSVSEYISENLIYDLLVKAIKKLGLVNIKVLCHYPLARLITDWDLFDEQEKEFAKSPLSHVDFLIYNSLTKQPIKVIEVDGWRFHKELDVQRVRDKLKDKLLTKLDLCPNRILTTDTINLDKIISLMR